MTRRSISSSAWTGRCTWEGSPFDGLRRKLRTWLYPSFDCDNCIGMPEHGCYCEATGAVAPGLGPEWWRATLRNRLHAFLFPTRSNLTIPADWPGV